jgi:hypothetical protein
MYLPQAVSLLPLPGIEWDLFRHIHIVHDVELEPTIVSSSFSELLIPAIYTLLGIDLDLLRHIHLVHDVELEPMVVSYSYSALLFPVIHCSESNGTSSGTFT